MIMVLCCIKGGIEINEYKMGEYVASSIGLEMATEVTQNYSEGYVCVGESDSKRGRRQVTIRAVPVGRHNTGTCCKTNLKQQF